MKPHNKLTTFDKDRISKEPVESDDLEDPINKLWGVIEPMMDKLSIDSQSTVDEVMDESFRIQHEMEQISESFFCPPKEIKSTVQENEQLKAQLAYLKNQIHQLERGSVDHSLLKSSIVQFKHDVHRQMQRALQSQESTNMTRSATGSPLARNNLTVDIMNRIKELEEANRTLRSQNRKQEALMSKYRERWEKLKEGAKKRQPQ